LLLCGLQVKVNSEKDVADIKTLMEEVDMRIAETKKDTFEFKRDIIIGAENARTGKTCADKMLRWASTTCMNDKAHVYKQSQGSTGTLRTDCLHLRTDPGWVGTGCRLADQNQSQGSLTMIHARNRGSQRNCTTREEGHLEGGKQQQRLQRLHWQHQHQHRQQRLQQRQQQGSGCTSSNSSSRAAAAAGQRQLQCSGCVSGSSMAMARICFDVRTASPPGSQCEG
jgi:hypothetical protein